MKEIEHLKTMWSKRSKRSLDLIVDAVVYEDGKGRLVNPHWAYDVTYAFRDALDLKFEERVKEKKPYMTWTQGPLLRFKDSDIIHARNGDSVLRVKYANPMGWDDAEDAMYEGSVIYEEYACRDGVHSLTDEGSRTQVEFLARLIGTGDIQ